MVVAFENLFTQARHFQQRGQITQAIAAYRDIAALATESHEAHHHCEAIFRAGQTAVLAISDATTSYYQDALTLLGEALQEAITLGVSELQGMIYREMATAADTAQDFANAAVLFQKSLELLSTADSPAELAFTYGKLGAHLGRLGQTEGGILAVEKALDLYRQEPLAGYYQALTKIDLGILYLRQDKPEAASDSWTEAYGWFVADHGEEEYELDLTRLYGLLLIVEPTEQKKWQRLYAQGLRRLEIVAAKAVRSNVDQLSNLHR